MVEYCIEAGPNIHHRHQPHGHHCVESGSHAGLSTVSRQALILTIDNSPTVEHCVKAGPDTHHRYQPPWSSTMLRHVLILTIDISPVVKHYVNAGPDTHHRHQPHGRALC